MVSKKLKVKKRFNYPLQERADLVYNHKEKVSTFVDSLVLEFSPNRDLEDDMHWEFEIENTVKCGIHALPFTGIRPTANTEIENIMNLIKSLPT